jgi:hypothetical protein
LEAEAGNSQPLRDALTQDLRSRMDDTPAVVMYAWSRPVVDDDGRKVALFARVFMHHRSVILDASGADGDSAYSALLNRCEIWIRDQA